MGVLGTEMSFTAKRMGEMAQGIVEYREPRTKPHGANKFKGLVRASKEV